MNRYVLAALSGVAFVVLLIVGFIVAGETPTAEDDTAEEIVSFYVDNEGSVMAGALLTGLASIFLIFFASYLRRTLALAAGGRDILATTTLIGATILVVGIAIDGSILAGLATTAEEIDPVAVQGLQAFFDNNFLPYAIGFVVFLLSAGLSLVLYRALPAWLGWAAIALLVVHLVAGIFEIDAFWMVFGIGTALWVITTSIMFAVSEGRDGAPGTTAPPAGAPPAGPTV